MSTATILWPGLPPADSLPFRQALAYAIDREAVARAAAPNASVPASNRPAPNIQYPALPGYTAGVRGYSYDPNRAKALYAQSGWTSPLSILTGPSRSGWTNAIQAAVADSIAKTLGTSVSFARVASFEVLTSSTKSGKVPIWMYGWRSDRRDYGYPSFALGLAQLYFMSDPDIRRLVESGAGQETEQVLLDKALIVPIIFYSSTSQ